MPAARQPQPFHCEPSALAAVDSLRTMFAGKAKVLQVEYEANLADLQRLLAQQKEEREQLRSQLDTVLTSREVKLVEETQRARSGRCG